MINLILAFFVLALCLLIVGVVSLNIWIETLRVGGLYHWRVRTARGVIFGGSFYRPARMRKNQHA
jgi:hypothetical protein